VPGNNCVHGSMTGSKADVLAPSKRCWLRLARQTSLGKTGKQERLRTEPADGVARQCNRAGDLPDRQLLSPVSSPIPKNIPLRSSPKSVLESRRLVPREGALTILTDAEAYGEVVWVWHPLLVSNRRRSVGPTGRGYSVNSPTTVTRRIRRRTRWRAQRQPQGRPFAGLLLPVRLLCFPGGQ
jgi:hypothetical protein